MRHRPHGPLLLLILLLQFVRPAPAGAQQVAEAVLAHLPLRAIGPAVMGGRIDDLAVVERTPWVIYVGAASGGVWKTINAGTTWEPIFDHHGVASIGDVAVSPSNPDIVWVGTGEPNNRQSSSFGDGVYKSIDGGRTFRHMGLRDTHHIGRILIDPTNPDVVYVAALGHLWGPNKERGLFKTTDGGATWTNTRFIDEDTGFVDAVMDPADPQVIYAAAYQRRRVPWGFNGGGPGSGLHKTGDGGRTWRRLAGGLPQGIAGRIGLDVSRSNPKIVYATVEHTEGGTFRSEDAGETWQKMSDVNPRPMYYSKIRVDPTNDRRVYVLGSSFFVSNDGGKSFADPQTGRAGANRSMSATYDVGVHGDHHALWINPANPQHLILGNDGGIYFSFDGSRTWDKVNNIPLAQFYGIGVDMRTPYTIYGGLQDTHSWGGPSATRHYLGITNADWFQINFGDGMYAQIDPSDPDTIYTESQDGNLVRFHRPTGDRKNIKPHPKPGEPPHRFNWTAPLLISPHDSKRLYFGGNRLFTSPDRGETWSAGPDLTRAEDRDKLPIMGVLPSPEMLSRHDGVSSWGTITTLAESPLTPGVLWVGTDDGLVQLSRDGGATWTNVTDRIASSPARLGRVSRVEPSHADAATAYVSFDRHQEDDFAPYIQVTADFGKTWKPIAGGLPRVGWVNVVREHPRNPAVLLAGTETGLYVTFDRGGAWTRVGPSLPTVPVDDLVIHPREGDIIVGTHGRALYVLDDSTSLYGLTTEVLNSSAHLFAPRPATILQRWKNESYSAQRIFAGPNPPPGAIIDYYLKASGADEVKVAVLDSGGAVVREIPGTKHAGINRVVWDLRIAGAEGVESARGPHVLPGSYSVRLSAGGRPLTRSVRVDPDPAFPMNDGERKARFTFLSTLSGLQGRLRKAAASLAERVKKSTEASEPAKGASAPPASGGKQEPAPAERLRELLAKIGREAGQGGGEEGGVPGGSLRGRANSLFNEVDGNGVQQGTLSGPTAVQLQRLEGLMKEFEKLQGEIPDKN